MERFPHLRENIVSKLLTCLPEMKNSRTMRGALWAVGEYSMSTDRILYFI